MAESCGFMSERKVTIRTEVEGADKAAADQKKLADGQHELTEAMRQGAQAGDQAKPPGTGEGDAKKIKDTAEATEELKASEQDLKDVLNQIHPAFGGLIDSMGWAMNLAGALGNKNIDLAGTAAKVTASVKANAGAYALLGAGGIAVGALVLLYRNWGAVKEKIEEAAQAAAKYAEIQGKLKAGREDTRAEVADTLAGLGAGDTETLDRAMVTRGRLARAGFGDVASEVAAGAAAQNAEYAQAVAMAVAAEQGKLQPTAPDAFRQLDRLMADPAFAESVRKHTEFRGAEDADRLGAGAVDEYGNVQSTRYVHSRNSLTTGSREDLLRLVEQQYGITGEDAERAVVIAMRLGIDERKREEVRRTKGFETKWVPFGEQAFEFKGLGGEGDEYGPASPVIQGYGEAIFDLMERHRRGKGTDPSQAQQNVTVIENHYGERVYNRERGAVRNGRSWRSQSGIG